MAGGRNGLMEREGYPLRAPSGFDLRNQEGECLLEGITHLERKKKKPVQKFLQLGGEEGSGGGDLEPEKL